MLHRSLWKGHEQVFRMLLRKGADAHALDFHEDSALIEA